MGVVKRLHVLVSVTAIVMMVIMVESVASHNYSVALTKSILFFEGQRSGKIPPTQRLKWRNDSALRDGFEIGVDLVGGYYDAGDNVKFSFPMAFSTTMLAWSVIDFGKNMDTDLKHALEAIHWGTDYLLKATTLPDLVFVQVGDARADHSCWERPEDMGTPRTPYAVSKNFPGSEVSAEIAAALAASSIVFNDEEPHYSKKLLERAKSVFYFADKYQASYNHSLGPWVCPYYCDYSGYQDELVWAAAWLYKATSDSKYMNYIDNNIKKLDNGFAEFGWDSKHAGINVLVGKMLMWKNPDSDIIKNANKFVCSIMPGSPTKKVSYSPGGLMFKRGSSNMQHATALSFLLLTYAETLHAAYKKVVCDNFVVNTYQIIQLARDQANYILGSNPIKMSYMVGYGKKYPKKIHHRGSSLPSIIHHPKRIACEDGKRLGGSNGPNPNLLIGAIVGGPHYDDSYSDSRSDFARSEPTTYINAPFVGVLAFLKSSPHSLSV